MLTLDDPRSELIGRLSELTIVAAGAAVVAGLVPGVLTVQAQVLAVALFMASSLLRALVPRIAADLAGASYLGVLAVTVAVRIWVAGLGPVEAVMLAGMVLLGAVMFGRRGIVVCLGGAAVMTSLAVVLQGELGAATIVQWACLMTAFGFLGALSWWQLATQEESHEAVLRGNDALLLQQSKYAELVRNAPDGVLAVGVDGRLRSVSPAVSRMSGFEDEALLGRCLWELPWWDDCARTELHEGFTRLLAGQTLESAVLGAHTRSGEAAWFDVRATLVRSSDGAMGVHATLRDVSDQERAERARESYEQHLKQAQRVELMGRLAGSVAHDFNNLLAVISANAELLSVEGISDLDELEDLRAAADLGARLTRKLMALTRSQHLEIGAVDVQSVLQGLRPVLRSALPESIDLSIHVLPRTPSVAAGPTHLEQLLVNLVVNARDAMPEGGSLRIEVGPCPPSLAPDHDHEIEAYPGEENPFDTVWVRIVIQDSGVGIDPEHRELVFEPFFSTKGTQGTGLGLATVLGIVQQLGGHVDLQSSVGEGSTFTLYLRGAEDDQTTEIVETPPAHRSQVRGGTVLLVEDGDPVRRATRRSLNHLGYQVVEVESVPEALTELERSPPDIVLSDVVMPHVTGVDLMREVRERWPDLPVVLMSAHASVPGAADADAFLPKPFSLESVATALERGRVVAQHRVESEPDPGK